MTASKRKKEKEEKTYHIDVRGEEDENRPAGPPEPEAGGAGRRPGAQRGEQEAAQRPREEFAEGAAEEPAGAAAEERTGGAGEEGPPTAEELRSVRKERDEYLEMAKRARADYLNLQRRMESQFAAARADAQGRLARDVVSVLDDLERAIAHAEEATDAESLLSGLRQVREKFLATLGRYEITPIEAEGRPFDHNYHHAIAEQPTDEAEPGTVVGVAEKGYMYGDRLLRPAQVVVACPKNDSEEDPDPETSGPGAEGEEE